uniref:Uncharacterized protein n=1 Tax=viral metagenome TaxID=1070528 RepID=A0A6C0BPA1_9ZZZZ
MDFISDYKTKLLQQLENDLKFVRPRDLGILEHKYHEIIRDVPKQHVNALTEQSFLGLKLMAILGPRPEGLSDVEYIHHTAEYFRLLDCAFKYTLEKPTP